MLTRKQHELLVFINDHIAETGVSPSFDEMKAALNLRSKSGIHRLVIGLEERGFIRRLPHRARALEIIRMPETAARIPGWRWIFPAQNRSGGSGKRTGDGSGGALPKRMRALRMVLHRNFVLAIGFLGLSATSFPALAEQPFACTEGKYPLRFGFYAHFAPVSHSASRMPDSASFNVHRGYEADLLSALEAIKGAKLSFSRRAIAAWDNIWLLPAGSEFDIVGGGITILESRTRSVDGNTAIVFTAGHIAFRQSLLVRAEDAARLARHQNLSGTDRVGALAGTTGEARLLELIGIADSTGVLAAGTRVVTPQRTIVADGGADYVINAAGASRSLAGRRQIWPESANLPTVVIFADESEMVNRLTVGRIDAIARGEAGNRTAARDHGSAFAVTALDTRAETGGFALAATNAGLAACLDRHIDWLTDGGRIGLKEWLNDSSVFMTRARKRTENAR